MAVCVRQAFVDALRISRLEDASIRKRFVATALGSVSVVTKEACACRPTHAAYHAAQIVQPLAGDGDPRAAGSLAAVGVTELTNTWPKSTYEKRWPLRE